MIEVKRISKRFGQNEVLRDVSLSVADGEVVCLIGPSGSGKSTVLRCINGLESYESGDILIDGQRVDRERGDIHKLRTRVGMVFQRFNLFPHRTVLENVTEGPMFVNKVPREEARAQAVALLEKVGLGQRCDAYPSQLSGGQQQRVAIARSLAMKPEAILFDEPTSALDPELVGEVLKVMQDLAQEGRTMVVVTHEMGFAREVSNQLVFLHKGLVEETGCPREVLANPQSERLKQFLSGSLK